MKRKAQAQMLETIAVLFVFFILVAIGLVFYTKVYKSGLEVEKEKNRQLKAIEIAQRVSSLPELQCSEDNIVSQDCIDIIKLDSADDIILDNEIFYYDLLLFSKINVMQIYPSEKEWLLYDRSLDDYSSKISTNIPISLFDPVENKITFGIMNIELFSQ